MKINVKKLNIETDVTDDTKVVIDSTRQENIQNIKLSIQSPYVCGDTDIDIDLNDE